MRFPVARKLIVVKTISHFAVVSTTASSTSTTANGWVVPNDGATFLFIDNTASGITTNFTVLVSQGADVNLTVGPRVYAVTAGISGFTGFFPIKTYGSQILITADNNTPGIAAYSMAASGPQDF